jgi:squalene-hopene/tetraprenyl-beta-curcumene cyclase
VRLPIVSYALPALIAIGLARHELGHRWLIAPLRNLWIRASLRKLTRVQPTSGGFLEAAPLSGFVTICLAATGRAAHPVAQQAVRFLNDTVRDDGSWAIDTTLNGWVTSLAGAVLATETDTRALRRWTLDRQARQTHSYTQSPAGGWSWTDLPGGVPDVDDSAAALQLLHAVSTQRDDETNEAASLGIRWLLGIQNGDGGFPTFCKGWGKLPFDRSCSDLTAHAMSAMVAWRGSLPALAAKLDRSVGRAVKYLQTTQRPDGAFLPMWFGSEQTPDEDNPVYGTARVLIGLRALDKPPADVCTEARSFLESQQNADGSFGPSQGLPGSIEETAVAMEAMVRSGSESPTIEIALEWLAQATEHGTHFPASPIGLYFARLWYAEELYPLIFTASALQAIRSHR